jgi:drug/metabolite transporter (DMT)-like permease
LVAAWFDCVAAWLTASMSSLSPNRLGRLTILGAALAWSTAGIGQRELEISPATQVAGRALFATVALAALVLVTERRRTVTAFRSIGRFGLLSAVLLAISSGTFFLALNYTTVANVLFMQAAAPFFAALLGWWLLGDRVVRRTWWAMALAAVGVIVMAVGSLDTGLSAVVLPLIVTGAFAGVIVITRHRRDISMMPATCTSQAMVVAVCMPFASFGAAGQSDWVILGALGFGQMAFGLALLTIGARLIPPAEVAVISLLEVVLGPTLVWLAYSERPGAATLLGGIVVTAAVLVQATAGLRRGSEPSHAVSIAGEAL